MGLRWSLEGARCSQVFGKAVNSLGKVSDDLWKVSYGLGKFSDDLGKATWGMGKVSNGLGKVSYDLGSVSDGLRKESDCLRMVSGGLGKKKYWVNFPFNLVTFTSTFIEPFSKSKQSSCCW